MALSLSTKETKNTKSMDLLEAYLKSACAFSKGMEKKDAKDYARTFLISDHPQFNADYGKPSTDKLLSEVKYEDILKKEKELKEQAKKAPFKAKANYQLNTEAKKDKFLSYLAPLSATLPGMAVLMSGAEQGSGAAMLVGVAGTVAGVGVAAGIIKIREMTKAKNETEQKAIDDYITVKHSQLALKQLKKEIEKEQGNSYGRQVQNLFASGLGNPGGMITPLALKNKGASR